MTTENELVCKWATYCLCCCLGDVLEPLEFVKREIKNAELRWTATTKWENMWGRNWGLCLAKLLGKTKAFRKSLPEGEAATVADNDAVVDETQCVELDPSSLDPFHKSDHSGSSPQQTPSKTPPKTPPRHSEPFLRKNLNATIYDGYRAASHFEHMNKSFHSRDSDNVLSTERMAAEHRNTTLPTHLMPKDATRSGFPSKSSLKPETPTYQLSTSTMSAGEVKFSAPKIQKA